MLKTLATALGLAATALLSGPAIATAADSTFGLKLGNPGLKSAGPLGFETHGIIFVGDTQGAALFAIDTGDNKEVAEKPAIKVEDLAGKVAASLGTDPKNVTINDLAVNPLSGNVYLSVSRGKGPDASPVLLRVNGSGRIEEVSLENVKFAKVDMPNAPSPTAMQRGQSLRAESITDIAYADGQVFVAGLSNEEFSSRLLAIPFPFTESTEGSGIEIYHGAHGKVETKSPVRTFVATTINREPTLLAAYTCTPLVKVPVAELKPGAHVRGTTVAELGNMNRPLDMVAYQKDGKDFLLLANSARGVMKIATEGVATAKPIQARVADKEGLGYETIAALKGVVQLDQLGKDRAVVIIKTDAGKMNLETIDLP